MSILSSEGPVNGSERLQLLRAELGLRIKNDLQNAAAINTNASALAQNLSRVHEILKDGIVDGGQSPAARALLLSLAIVARLLSDNAALADDNNVFAAELLLKLTNQADVKTLELAELVEGDSQDNSLLAIVNLKLLGTKNVKVTELCLQFSIAHVGEELSNLRECYRKSDIERYARHSKPATQTGQGFPCEYVLRYS